MLELLFKIWWMIGIMPFMIFQEATKKFSAFLKKRNIYSHWDSWHSLVIVLIIFLIALLLNGYR